MEKKKKNFKPLIIVLIIIGIIVFGISGCVSKFKKAISEFQLYDSYTVDEQNLSEHISVSGHIASDSVVNESSELVGVKVKKVYVQVGDTVDKGDILVEYDVSSYQDQLNKALAAEKKAKSGLQKAYNDAVSARDKGVKGFQDQIDSLGNQLVQIKTIKSMVAENNFDVINNVYFKCDPSKDTFDISYDYCPIYSLVEETLNGIADEDDNLDVAGNKKDLNAALNILINKTIPESISGLESEKQSTYNTLSAAVDEAKSALDEGSESSETIKELREQIASARVKASKSGTVTAVNVVEGSMQATGGVVATIQGTRQYKVTVPINEVDILKLKSGMKATITCLSTGKKTYSGYVNKIITTSESTSEYGGYGDVQSGASYAAEVVMNDTETKLLVGMSAKVNILLSEEKTVIAIPYDSYITDGDETFVNVLIPSDDKKTYTVKRQKVTLGEEKDYYVEITDGLKVGDKILLYQEEIAEGTQINAQLLDLMDEMELTN
jgi:RND family efflux transporter MFP subunit